MLTSSWPTTSSRTLCCLINCTSPLYPLSQGTIIPQILFPTPHSELMILLSVSLRKQKPPEENFCVPPHLLTTSIWIYTLYYRIFLCVHRSLHLSYSLSLLPYSLSLWLHQILSSHLSLSACKYFILMTFPAQNPFVNFQKSHTVSFNPISHQILSHILCSTHAIFQSKI